MSLINDVLRDLDERRQRGGCAQGSVLADLRPAARPGALDDVRWRRAIGVLGAGFAAGLVCMFFFRGPAPEADLASPATVPSRATSPGPPSPPSVSAAAPIVPHVPIEGTTQTHSRPAATESGRVTTHDTVELAAVEPIPVPAAAPPREAPRSPEDSAGVVERRSRPPTAGQLAERAYREALRMNERADEEAAREGLAEALDLAPSHRGARLALAALLARSGRLSDAKALLDAGLAADPLCAPFAELEARILVEMKALDEAVAVLERAAPPVRSDPDFHGFLAALYQRQGRYDQATRLYREILRLDGRRAIWWMGLGIGLEAEGRPDGALAAYRGSQRVGGLDAASQRFVEARIGELAGLSPSPPARMQR